MDKGEWKVSKYTNPDNYAVKADGRLIAMNVSSEANAHLIAQSPKMYEWIKNIGLHLAVNYDEENKPYFIIDKDYLDEANDILSKAKEGE